MRILRFLCKPRAVVAWLTGAIVLASGGGSSPLFSASVSEDGSPRQFADDQDGNRMRQALETLWSGTPEEKLAVADDAPDLFLPLDSDSPDPVGDESRRIVTSFRALLLAERDDWILTRLLQGLIEVDEDVLTPLFRDALGSRSPNVRRRAIQWFQDAEDPEAVASLESLWTRENRPWIREDLMRALASQGSSMYADEFGELARGEEPELATAAVEALGDLEDPSVIPILLDLLRRGSHLVRTKALSGLEGWTDSREALDAVLELSSDGELDLRWQAIRMLGKFGDHAAAERLVQAATSAGDTGARHAAIDGLAAGEDPMLVPVLTRILQEPDSSETAGLKAKAARILRSHGIETPATMESFSSFSSVLDPEPWRVRRVVPPPGLGSIRCWKGPELAGDPGSLGRIPEGTVVRVTDLFERGDDLWFQIEGALFSCWVRESQLGTIPVGAEGAAEEADGLLRHEFDVEAAEMSSDAAVDLLRAGLLEPIEPGDEVVGLALVVDPHSREDAKLLIRTGDRAGAILESEILALLEKVAPRHADDLELAREIASALDRAKKKIR